MAASGTKAASLAADVSPASVCSAMLRRALARADPAAAVREQLRWGGEGAAYGPTLRVGAAVVRWSATPDPPARVVVVGAGKASAEMAAAAVRALELDAGATGRRAPPCSGLVITKRGHGRDPAVRGALRGANVEVVEADHPVPDEDGARATRRLLELLRATSDARTLVVWCASGGGSALTGGLSVAPDRISVRDVALATDALLRSGAPIEDVNAVRKHMCAAHGGRAALAAGASFVLTLVVSDVIGAPLHAVAGGPTQPDPTTMAECRAVLDRLGGARALPASVADHFYGGDAVADAARETLKALPRGSRGAALVVAELRQSLLEAATCAREMLGPDATVAVLTSRMAGEASEVAKLVAGMAIEGPALVGPGSASGARRFALVLGGETTVTVPRDCAGRGGRNQEMALAVAVELARARGAHAESRGVAVLVAGTDGTDGPTDAAGAVVDDATVPPERVTAAADALRAHDSYSFFAREAPQAHVRTGPTGTNVCDVVFIVGVEAAETP